VTVSMRSDYSGISGIRNTLVADMADIVSFESDGLTIRLVFRGGVSSVSLNGFIPQADTEDLSKFRKTPELIDELEAYAKYLDDLVTNYKQSSSGLYLRSAADNAAKASVVRSIINDLREGDRIWDTDE
jgi:hypothetical protein